MGSLMEDVVTCKKTLEEAASSEEQVIDALKLLSSTPVTKQLLTKTLIGKTVNKLVMKHKSSAVKSLAKDLVAKWREVAGTPMSTPKSSPDSTPVSAVKAEPGAPNGNRFANPPTPGDAVKAEPGVKKEEQEVKKEDGFIPLKSEKTSPTKEEKENTEAFQTADATSLFWEDKHSTHDPKRDTVIKKIFESLRPKMTEEDPEPLELAIEIEKELWRQIATKNPDEPKKGNQDYVAQMRSICYNLRDRSNLEFRMQVLRRTPKFEAKDLPTATAEDMASMAKRNERQQIRKEASEALQLDWDVRHGKAAVSGMFQCGKCKNWKCTYTQAQTRSADEPMTTFVTCTVCNNRWKFS